jgi:hypothetical protein
MLTTKPILSPGVKFVSGELPFAPSSADIVTSVNVLDKSNRRRDTLGLVCEGREEEGEQGSESPSRTRKIKQSILVNYESGCADSSYSAEDPMKVDRQVGDSDVDMSYIKHSQGNYRSSYRMRGRSGNSPLWKYLIPCRVTQAINH